MRIAFVSTYPPIECGIGTYTAFLVEALTKTPSEIHIVSQYGAEGRHVYPSYSPGENGIAAKIFDAAVKVTPDLVQTFTFLRRPKEKVLPLRMFKYRWRRIEKAFSTQGVSKS